MTPRLWILGIILILISPFVYFFSRYLLQSSFVQPYLSVVSSFFSVPSYIRASEVQISDFGSGTTLVVLCEWGSAECVMTISRLTDLVQMDT